MGTLLEIFFNNKKMERFRVRKQSTGQVVFKSDSLPAVNEHLKGLDTGLECYLIEDLEEDLEIVDYELLEAFAAGECPEDLTFF